MIPIRDELPTRRFPIVTVLLILMNTIVFFYEVGLGPERELFFLQAGLVPALFWGKVHMLRNSPLPPLLTLITSMFLHGSFFHLLSNMWYLWIFGNNVEDFLGWWRFVLFYLGCGCIAGLSHALAFPTSLIPTVGASGAIAGVMGGYFLLFPGARIITLVFWGFFVQFLRIPAVVFLGFWILLQIFYAMVSLGFPGYGGVAWFAHVSGFVAGALWCKIIASRTYRRIYW
ncbi:MAG: rhomboid family intramembrane serine protease [Candidatus Caldatribacterium sp.]|uniref:rhomboid family intramembrane serine protease n=1 Tax=Candidatus Caldatribacterium sp. TaxID=2282143 RepID=UPI00299AD53F|nr:rhomboid family intramembrane serine protease [Candidatus Caldatribacterium sp.]MCX7730279.1 rhomboid family intramembrane serine protease [Candidatus Caldatribacterium sp.]MDW8080913.1 rhomboid family intramembrane serine protease [Candidatus Calescibacterium sp.]